MSEDKEKSKTIFQGYKQIVFFQHHESKETFDILNNGKVVAMDEKQNRLKELTGLSIEERFMETLKHNGLKLKEMTDTELILKYTGWSSFDPSDWRDVMNLVTKIETSKPFYSVWLDITPSTTRITFEPRDSSGEKLRIWNEEFQLFMYSPIKTYQKSNKERDKKKHIIETCVQYIKDNIGG